MSLLALQVAVPRPGGAGCALGGPPVVTGSLLPIPARGMQERGWGRHPEFRALAKLLSLLMAKGGAQHLERGVHPVPSRAARGDTPGRAMLPRAPQPAVGQPRTGTAGTGTRGSGAARTRPVLVSGTPAAQRLGRGCSRHPRQPGRDAEPLLAHAW